MFLHNVQKSGKNFGAFEAVGGLRAAKKYATI
jgi:hypothetical protein